MLLERMVYTYGRGKIRKTKRTTKKAFFPFFWIFIWKLLRNMLFYRFIMIWISIMIKKRQGRGV